MGRLGRVKERHTLVYPKGSINPEDLLHFVQLEQFVEDWDYLDLADEDLRLLEITIMTAPRAGKVMQGVGLRKMRYAPQRWPRGKSGGVRVLYAYFPDYFTVILFAAYGKGEKEDITAAEKKALRGYLREIEEQLRRRYQH